MAAPLPLTKLSETATTITLGWAPVGDRGYRFTREKANGVWSNTWDPTVKQATFSKDSAWYKVEALGEVAAGQYPPAVAPAVTSSLADGQEVTAPVIWEARVSGYSVPTVDVFFYIDGIQKWVEHIAPYYFNGDPNGRFDPATYQGPHVLKIVASANNGKETAEVTVNVTGKVPVPPPNPGWPYETLVGICDGASPPQSVLDGVKQMWAVAGKKMPLRQDLYAMSGYAAPFDNALANGVPTLGTMFGTMKPGTNDQIGNPPNWPPRGSAAWAGKVAGVYKGKLPLWEVMNEPDGQGWQPVPYAQLACSAAEAIRAADPAVKISTGGIYKSTPGISVPEFTRAIVAEMEARGKMDLFDYFAVHPYDPLNWNDPRSQWHMTFPYGDRAKGDTMREILDDNGLAHIPIISTEYGNASQNSGDAAQAADLQSKFDMIKPGFLAAGIQFCLTQRGGQFPQFAITRADGSRKPGWTTTANAAKAHVP